MKLPFIKSYCIDTNVLITLKRYYPKKEPAFKAIWNEIELLIKEGSLYTVKYVEDEIKKYMGDDVFLKKWIMTHKKNFIVSLTPEIWEAAQKIINDHPDLLDEKKLANNEPEADPFLIALAYVKGSSIITQESKAKSNRIPAIATHYQIKCINLFEFLNERDLAFKKR